MNYREALPSPEIAEHVKCFWSLEYDREMSPAAPEVVVPDGAVEIVFNFSDRFRRFHADGEVETQAASIVAGQMTQSVVIGPSGDVRLFGIRFTAAGAFAFFDNEISEVTNRIESLGLLWGCVAQEFEDRLFCAASFERRVAIAESMLAGRSRQHKAIDPWLTRAVDLIASTGGTTPIYRLSREIGISERGLERRFKRFVGVTPKMLSRITRFQTLLRTFGPGNDVDLAHKALECGYYDQSHLINDFHQFAGTTPSVYLHRTNSMSELFSSGQ